MFHIIVKKTMEVISVLVSSGFYNVSWIWKIRLKKKLVQKVNDRSKKMCLQISKKRVINLTPNARNKRAFLSDSPDIYLDCTLNITHIILYIYHMALRVIYQHINPEVTRKPWRVMAHDAEGNFWIFLKCGKIILPVHK